MIHAITYGELLQNAYNSAKNYMAKFYETAQDKVDRWTGVLREKEVGDTFLERRKNLAKKLWAVTTKKDSQQDTLKERETRLKHMGRAAELKKGAAEFEKGIEALKQEYFQPQKIEQPVIVEQEEQLPSYSYAIEALQNNGARMNDFTIGFLTTSDRHIFNNDFWGIFHGKLNPHQITDLYTNYRSLRNSESSLRDRLIKAYVDLVKDAKENIEGLNDYRPTGILKGVAAAADSDKIALMVSSTFGAFVLRGDNIIYAYEFNQKNETDDVNLQKDDLIFLFSPGFAGGYERSNRYAKIAEKWFAADRQSDRLFEEIKQLEEQSVKTTINNIKLRLEREMREKLPLSSDSVVRIGEENSDKKLRAQLYCMLTEVQKIVQEKNLSCVVIKINKDMILEKPIVLTSPEVTNLFK